LTRVVFVEQTEFTEVLRVVL